MPQIVVTIDEKTYRMACGEGEERHLTGLAANVDGKIGELRQSFGQIGDLRLTVMAAITLADELSEARRRIAELEGGIDKEEVRASAQSEARRREREGFIETMDEAAAALEKISARLASPRQTPG